jgi:hypothetical protein
MTSVAVRLVLLALAVAAAPAQRPAPRARPTGPPMPYEDIGACPFECCVYRDWVANDTVAVRRDRRRGAPVVFTLKPGDHVRAITGVVVTLAPGRVRFRQPEDLTTTEGTLHVGAGETLYLLTYHGEGATTAWFKGHVYDEVDGSGFIGANCETDPDSCNGRIVEQPTTEWWVRVKSRGGRTGWTREPEKFDNKDACGG